jgi:hypothetical protein
MKENALLTWKQGNSFNSNALHIYHSASQWLLAGSANIATTRGFVPDFVIICAKFRMLHCNPCYNLPHVPLHYAADHFLRFIKWVTTSEYAPPRPLEEVEVFSPIAWRRWIFLAVWRLFSLVHAPSFFCVSADVWSIHLSIFWRILFSFIYISQHIYLRKM